MSKKILAGGMAGKNKGRTSHWGNTNSEVKAYAKKARRVALKKLLMRRYK